MRLSCQRGKRKKSSGSRRDFWEQRHLRDKWQKKVLERETHKRDREGMIEAGAGKGIARDFK